MNSQPNVDLVDGDPEIGALIYAVNDLQGQVDRLRYGLMACLIFIIGLAAFGSWQ